MNLTIEDRIQKYLYALYGENIGHKTWSDLRTSLVDFRSTYPQPPDLTAYNSLENLTGLLITYADQFQAPENRPLQTLADFMESRLKGLISEIHLLPFFPYSSDDGFSVIDYKAVDPTLGSWADLARLRGCCQLMFDLVLNHTSSQSAWFQSFLKDQAPFNGYFLSVDPGENLSQVVRPREMPLLTPYATSAGERHVWTTFSPDQIDLNFKNPAVLLEFIDIMLFYIKQGASILRLDAIAYLWKEIGTPCIHLPQTHQIIKLLRAVLDYTAPGVILITETNVPHEENISYFGEQLPESPGGNPLGDEAQLVYQFPLAPLVLHTFRTENTRALTDWAASIKVPFSSAAFLNFIASHDGIGVRPVEGLLTGEEIQGLVDQTLEHNGLVSYKSNQDGTKSVYELNITLYDVLNHPLKTPLDTGVKRFMASQAIMLSLSGIPGIYVHSLFGSSNSMESFWDTGRARSVNRKKFSLGQLEAELDNPSSLAARIFTEYSHFLGIRKEHPAFRPLAPQKIIEFDQRVFAVLRTAGNGAESILCLINVSSTPVIVKPTGEVKEGWPGGVDLISGAIYPAGEVALEPFQVVWLELENPGWRKTNLP